MQGSCRSVTVVRYTGVAALLSDCLAGRKFKAAGSRRKLNGGDYYLQAVIIDCR
jgi:hypothetical protein